MWDCFVSSSWNGHGDAPAGNTAKKGRPCTILTILTILTTTTTLRSFQKRRRKKCVSVVCCRNPKEKKSIKTKFQAPRKAFIKETVDTRAKIVALSTIEPTDVNSRARVARIFRVFDKNKRERERERKKEKRKAPLCIFLCLSVDDDVPLRTNLCL